MAFQLSPGVLVREIDLTQVVPAVATSPGAFAGAFQWGPVDEVINISSENELVSVFGEPNAETYTYFFTAANFLSYGSNLQVVRAETGNLNATQDGSGFLIKNMTHYDNLGASAVATGVGDWAAKYPGTLGNSLKVSTCTSANAYTQTSITTTAANNSAGETSIVLADSSAIGVGDLIVFDGHSTEYEVTANDGSTTVTINELGKTTGLTQAVDGSSVAVNVTVKWRYHADFDNAPGTSAQATAKGGSADEMHVIVIDEDGNITGTAGTVLEKFGHLSVAIDAKKSDGTVNWYVEHINQYSNYIVWGDHFASMDADVGNSSAGLLNNAFSHTNRVPQYASLSGGTDDNAPTDGELQTAYAHFANDELYDVSLIPTGPASGTVSKWVVDNVAEIRKDCMVFLSPELADSTSTTAAEDIVDFRNNTANINSSYAVMDSGWKYQYDRYSDVYRWVPLNGDVAGCCVRTDLVADPFFSPAGFNRGQIKNAVKVAFSPDKTDRDTLYKKGVNPVVSFPGQGVVLFGDKTMLTSPSAFDRINVRRLFIVLEKAIATAAKFQLFEFNDTFTRANFRNLVEPFLRDIQGRRGMYDFKVVCDETNNTPTVIDANEFRADIFIKPARSINFITLTFVATRTGISFEETGV
jgi:hypothetical protein